MDVQQMFGLMSKAAGEVRGDATGGRETQDFSEETLKVS
jgi:hypothetical protein